MNVPSSFEQALAALVGGMTSKAAPKTQTQKIPSKNAPAQQKIVRTTTKQQRYSQLKARTVQVQKPALRKPQTTVLKLKPAGDRRTGISITRVVGGGRTIGNSALKKVTAKGDLKNRIRVQPGSYGHFGEWMHPPPMPQSSSPSPPPRYTHTHTRIRTHLSCSLFPMRMHGTARIDET